MRKIVPLLLFLNTLAQAQERNCDLKVNLLFPEKGYVFISPGDDSVVFSFINQGPDTIIPEDKYLYELWMNGYYYPLRTGGFGKTLLPGDSLVVRTTIKQIAKADIPDVTFCVNRCYAWNTPEFKGRRVKSETKDDPSFDDNKDCVLTSLKYQPTASIHSTKSASLLLYPNPCENVVHITSQEKIKHVVVKDITGRTVLKEEVYDNKINTGSLPTGYYYFVLTNTEYSTFRQIILKQ